MKFKNTSFLYIFFLLVLILLGQNIVFAQNQNEKDTLLYYYNLAVKPKEANHLSKAYKFYNKKVKRDLEAKDTLSAISDLRMIAIIQSSLGSYYESEKSVMKAIRLINSQKNNVDTTNAMTGLYNQLGLIHRSLYNYDQAIKYYQTAIAKNQVPSTNYVILNNIANIYIDKEDYDLAVIELQDVYSNSIKNSDTLREAISLNNLGYAKTKLNNPEGLIDIRNALKMRQKMNEITGLYSSYKTLTQYFQSANQKDSALFYARKAYKTAKAINSASFLEDALSNLINVEGNNLAIEYKNITDSIAKAKQLQENKFAEIQYSYSEYERKAQESQLAASEQRTKTLVYQFAGLTILLMSIFLYIILRNRHKKEKLIKVYETETRISKKVHDEVANDIFRIMSKLQTSKSNDGHFLDELEDVYVKTRDISKENSDILHSDFKSQLEDLLNSYHDENVNIITKGLKDVDWKLLSNQKKVAIYRVLQELMTNMKKHSKATLVVLKFEQTKKLTIAYKDNGIGTTLHKGSGCTNMENRIASVDGIINFESEPGAGFKATLTV
ncbi:ATP-binding protein [Subsaxibacter sp. CAU 1640]|uniref:tetratricopeptide repeat-containing sensor histidine kinase n=1 Tax=Subsaxibacter sp. CAU 1640 TaxID=2933271 RepID=UPI002005F3C0|nr:tetratricopeptide repeat protein [Subsaxibacter sp. CAU 1640]MCK7590634.1 ATP-binding protein [Subsaxibacter sp. CAU 1640]